MASLDWRYIDATTIATQAISGRQGMIKERPRWYEASIVDMHTKRPLSTTILRALDQAILWCERTLALSSVAAQPLPASAALPEESKIIWVRQCQGVYYSNTVHGRYGVIGPDYASIHDERRRTLIERCSCTSFREGRLWCEQRLRLSSSTALTSYSPAQPPSPPNDWRFLESLKQVSPRLRELAALLVAQVRRQFPGELQYHQISERWVESPDNFWTIKVQPEDHTIRITLRADGKKLYVPSDIKLSTDRPSYTTFKFRKLSQVSSAFILIQQAAHNRPDAYFFSS